MKNIFLILSILLFGYSAFAQNTDPLLTHYYSVKNALVNSNTQVASVAIHDLQKAIHTKDDFKHNADLNKAVDKLAQEKGLDRKSTRLNHSQYCLTRMSNT